MRRAAVLFLTAALAVSSVPFSVKAQEEDYIAVESVENGVTDSESVENESDMSQPEEDEESGKEEVTGEDSEKDEQSEEGMTPDEVPGEDMKEEPSTEDGNMTENPDVEKIPESEEPAEQAVMETQDVPEEKTGTAKPVLTYQAHVQNEGWQSWRQESEMAGTEGKYRRMEALRIKLQGGEESVQGSVEYRAHVQDYGWMAWKKDGELAGTQGQSKPGTYSELWMVGLGEKRCSGRKCCTEFTDGKLHDPAGGKGRSITGNGNKGIYQSIYECESDLSRARSKDRKYESIS